MKTVIFGGEIHQPGRVIQKGYLVIEDDTISEVIDVSSFSESRLEQMVRNDAADIVINAKGKVVAPGSMDIHTHGFAGKQFIDAAPGSLDKILETYAMYGVTAVSPTIVTAPKGTIASALENIYKRLRQGGAGATLLPVHLECRYFSNGPKKAAHDPNELVYSVESYKERYGPSEHRNLSEIILDEIKEFSQAAGGFIGIVTIDPSLPDAVETIGKLRKLSYIISIGHTNGTILELLKIIKEGDIICHLGNGMSSEGDYQGVRVRVDYNQKNILGGGLDRKRVYGELILDFVHVSKEYAKMFIGRKGIDEIILISDACAVAGSEERECRLGDTEVEVKEKNNAQAGYFKSNNTLCGSVLTMDQAIRNAVSIGYSLNEAFRMVSINPARAMRIDNVRGSIEQGKYADIVVYKKDGTSIGEVCCTLVEGKIVYQAPMARKLIAA